LGFGFKESIILDVKEIMVDNVVSIEAGATVKDAVLRMNQHDIGCLVVTKKGQVEGIVTERDVLKRVVSKSKNPDETEVSDVMSKPLIVGGPTMYVEDAAKLMLKKSIKKLPIMENEQIIGIITFSDIAKVANIEPQMVKVIEELKKNGWLPSGKMKKVADFYIA
jgi:CBS domain-containing protein